MNKWRYISHWEKKQILKKMEWKNKSIKKCDHIKYIKNLKNIMMKTATMA